MQQTEDLARLEVLIASLGGGLNPGTHSEGSCKLLLGHLETARRNLLGTMRNEYALSLDQAKSAIACIPVGKQRDQTRQTLQSLIGSQRMKRG